MSLALSPIEAAVKRYTHVLILAIVLSLSLCPAPILDMFKPAAFFSCLFMFALCATQPTLRKHVSHGRATLPFIIAMSFSLLPAIDKGAAVNTYLFFACSLFFIVSLTQVAITTRRDFDRLSLLICMVSTLVSLYGIFEIISHRSPFYDPLDLYGIRNPYYGWYILMTPTRPISTQFHVGPLATYLLGCLPFAVYEIEGKRKSRIALGVIALLLNAFVLFRTFSRGAIISCAIIVVIYFVMRRKFILLALFSLALCIASICMGYMDYPYVRFSPLWLFGSEGKFSDLNVSRYKLCFQILAEHPLFGIGLDNFRNHFYAYYRGAEEVPLHAATADNMYLGLLVETGIVGFLGFFTSLILVGKKALRAFMSVHNFRNPLFFALLSLVGLLLNLVSYDLFYWPGQYWLLCIIIGVTYATASQDMSGEGSEQKGGSTA